MRQSHEAANLAIGGKLHRLRSNAGWSIEALARASGVHPGTIEAIENGRTDPQLSTLIRAFYPLGRSVLISLVANGHLETPGFTAPQHPMKT